MKQRFLWLDFLRGGAALGVLAFHVVVVTEYKQLDGLYVLVDFFFVLSGFVLWPTLPHDRTRGYKEYSTFFFKRLLRLWPMLFFALFISNLIYWIGYFTSDDPTISIDENRGWKLVLAAIFMLQIVVSSSMFMVVPLWSLSAEWFTNLIYGFLSLINGSKGLWLGILLGYGALNYGLDSDWQWIGFIGPIRGWEAVGRGLIDFGIGVLLRKNYQSLRKYQNIPLLIIAGYGVWWSFFSYKGFDYDNTYFVGWIFAFFILQISKYELRPTSRMGRFARTLGLYSYGIYVYHQITIDFSSWWITRPGDFDGDSLWIKYFIYKSFTVLFLAILFTWITAKIFEGPIQRWGAKRLKSAGIAKPSSNAIDS